MKPIRFGDIEKTLSGLSNAQLVSAPSPSAKTMGSKAKASSSATMPDFLEESPKLGQKLRAAIADADREVVMRAAHSLKGEVGYLGAPGAAQAARELEDMGHEKNLSRATKLFTLLERELAGLHVALKDPAGATW